MITFDPFKINLEPGIKYELTDQFAIVVKLGSLYFEHYDPKVAGAGGFTPQNGAGIQLSTGLNFGLVYTF